MARATPALSTTSSRGLRDDPNGPRLDVSKDIISKLGKRVTFLADAEKPIGINSSRSLTRRGNQGRQGGCRRYSPSHGK